MRMLFHALSINRYFLMMFCVLQAMDNHDTLTQQALQSAFDRDKATALVKFTRAADLGGLKLAKYFVLN